MKLREGGIELYEKAIAEAFPQLTVKQVQLDRSGWDNVVAIVNHEILFRFPRRPEVARGLGTESCLLSELRRVISLPIRYDERDQLAA